MHRELIIALVVSLVSIVAGVFLYRATLYQPDYISASPEATNKQPVVHAIKFDQIVLNDLQQQARYLNDWQQPVLVLNFWAPWCAPCRREIPDLIALQNDHPDKLQLIGLSFDSQQNVLNFSKDYAFNYPLLLVKHEASQLNQYFGNNSSGLPFTVILNQYREIVYRHQGEVSKEQLESHIRKLL